MQGMPGWMKWTISLLIGIAIVLIGFRFAGWLLTAFYVMNCLVLIIVVLLQSGKAADLAGAFGGAGSQTAFGPRGAASALSKATTWSAVAFMVTSITLSVYASRRSGPTSVLQGVKSQPVKTQPAPAPKVPTPPAQQK